MYTFENKSIGMEYILDIKGVSKTFGTHKAVNEVHLKIPTGKIFGLLGPNGAGKTTLIRMITRITNPDSGEIFFQGERLNGQHPERIGYMPEERGLYKKMKVGEQLLYLARLKGLTVQQSRSAVREWMEKLQIESWWNKPTETLSKGMQQKVQFIATILHRPQLLILDEPFSGLDPVNAKLIGSEIDELHKQGTTIIFSTHRMEQVEAICERIALINKGSCILEGPVSEVKHARKEHQFSFQLANHIEHLPEDIVGFRKISQSKNNWIFQNEAAQNANDLLKYFVENDIPVHSMEEVLPSLNDIFIKEVSK